MSELQREMLIDRGPSSVPSKGIPYLSKEGFPYRMFERVHPELINAARKLKPAMALEIVRAAAGPIPAKKFAALFKLCLKPEERALTS